MTLTEFLLARIAEDEAAARATHDNGGGRWWSVASRKADEGDGDWFVRAEHPADLGGGDPTFSLAADYICSDSGWMDDDHTNLAHIARHDPARVLAECEAKRRIVEIHYNGSPDSDPERCSPCDTVGNDPCPTLRALALPYADHPDYRDEWRP